jgi:hypothetical protein
VCEDICDTAPCSLVGVDRRFRDTALYPRRISSSGICLGEVVAMKVLTVTVNVGSSRPRASFILLAKTRTSSVSKRFLIQLMMASLQVAITEHKFRTLRFCNYRECLVQLRLSG